MTISILTSVSSMVGSLAAGPAYYRDAAVRGNVFQRQYQLKAADGTPVNLTGFQVRWRGVYGDVVLEKSTANSPSLGMVMTTPENGTVLLSLVPAETRLIPAEENMKYELEVFQGNSQETVLWGDLVGKGGATLD